jgi:hypothetical protein
MGVQPKKKFLFGKLHMSDNFQTLFARQRPIENISMAIQRHSNIYKTQQYTQL